MQKVLIIKTGYSEILDKKSDSREVSYGDVLRITPLLHLYKEDHITWVTDIKAFPLLRGNKYIDNLLPYDFTTVLRLESEEFDKIINLEKIPGICSLADKIKARRSRHGFVFNTQTGTAEAYDRAFEILTVASDPQIKKENERNFQELLFEVVGEKWNKEEYILGYKPKTKEIYDIGLNNIVGKKWPIKNWPNENWNKLEKILIKNNFKVSRQDKQSKGILTNLYDYMDWVNSCKMIVSNDSLGMHLGIAMRKKVLGLFGPTPNKEVYFYDRGKAIVCDNQPSCRPCLEPVCKEKKNCIGRIYPKNVYKEIENLI